MEPLIARNDDNAESRKKDVSQMDIPSQLVLAARRYIKCQSCYVFDYHEDGPRPQCFASYNPTMGTSVHPGESWQFSRRIWRKLHFRPIMNAQSPNKSL